MDQELYPTAQFTLMRENFEDIELGNNKKENPMELTAATHNDGSSVDPVTIENGGTTYQFGNLPKFDEYGREISYVVKEEPIAGYTEFDLNPGEFTMINEYVGEKSGLADGLKTFTNLPENLPIERYPEVTIKLIRQMQKGTPGAYELIGTKEVARSTKVTYNEDETPISGTYSFAEIEIYGPNGIPYKYWIQEEVINGYEKGFEEHEIDVRIDGNHTVDLVNTYATTGDENPGVTIKGVKNWRDGSNQYNTRPEDVSLTLYRQDGTKDADGKLISYEVEGADYQWNKTSIANTWTFEFDDTFEKYAPNGNTYEYIVKETAIKGYNSQKDIEAKATESNGYSATLTNRLDETQLTVTKIWQYNDGERITDNAFGLFDDDMLVEFEIYRTYIEGDGSKSEAEKISGEYKIKASELRTSNGEGSYTFKQLPRYRKDSGEEYSYFAKEVAIELNQKRYALEVGKIGAYTVSEDGNTFTNELEAKKLSVIIDWSDEKNRDGIRPGEVVVKAAVEDVQGDPTANTKEFTVTGPSSEELDEKDPNNEKPNTWIERSFNVPSIDMSRNSINYSVGQKDLAPYDADNEWVKDNADSRYEFENTYVPKKNKIVVTKVWADDSDWEKYRQDIDVMLSWEDVPVGEEALMPHSETERLGKDDNPRKVEFLDLYVNTNPTYVNAADTGTSGLIAYTVTESTVLDGYKNPVITPNNGVVTLGSSGEVSVSITNTLDTVSHTVEKDWKDTNNRYGSRPADDKGDSIIFVKIQRRLSTAGDDADWEDVYKNDNRIGIYAVPIAGGLTTNTEDTANRTITFSGLPKTDTNNVDYVYRGVEFGIKGAETNQHEVNYGDEGDADKKNTLSGEVYHYSVTNTETTGKTIISNEIKNTKDIKVIKEWDDEKNQDGKRPDTITVKLVRDKDETGMEEVISQTLSKADKNADNTRWEYIFEDVPVYRNTQEAESTYDIEEEAVTGYTTTPVPIVIEESETDGYVANIKNSFTPVTMDITASKTWSADNVWWSDVRPDSITLTLSAHYVDGTGTNPVSIAKPVRTIDKDDWAAKVSWTNLPQYVNPTGTLVEKGTSYPIVYTVTETAIPGYTISYQSQKGLGTAQIGNTLSEGSGSVTVTNTMDTLDISAVKKWNHGLAEDINDIPESVTVKLMRRLKSTDAEYEAAPAHNEPNEFIPEKLLNGGNEYKTTFSDLPTTYDYKVIETKINDTALTNDSALGYDMGSEINGNTTTFTNTRKTKNLTVKKVWLDNTNKYKLRSDVEAVLGEIQYKVEGSLEDYTKLEEFTIANDPTKDEGIITISGLPIQTIGGKNYLYRVVETGFKLKDGKGIINAEPNTLDATKGTIRGYTYSAGAVTPVPEVDNALAATITNTPILVNLDVKKIWSDDPSIKSRPGKISFTLVGVAADESTIDVVKELSLTNRYEIEAPWDTKTINNLPQIYIDDNSKVHTIQYSVVEDTVKGYTTAYTGGSDGKGTYTTVQGTGDTGSTIDVTNTSEKENVTVEKKWEDFDDLYKLRPGSISVGLYAKYTSAPDGSEIQIGDDVTLEGTELNSEGNEQENWKHTWHHLPKVRALEENDSPDYVTYSVKEIEPTGYTMGQEVSSNGDTKTVTITNTLETVSFGVEKIWKHNGDNDGTEVTVEVLQDGESFIATSATNVVLDEDNLWKHTWTELPKYKTDGTEYSYSAKELKVDGEAVDGDKGKGYTITEETVPGTITADGKTTITNTKETVDLTVTKLWAEGAYPLGIRELIKEIKVQLQRRTDDTNWEKAPKEDGVIAANPVAPDESEYIFSDNSKYASDNGVYKYRVVETAIVLDDLKDTVIETSGTSVGGYDITVSDVEDCETSITNTSKLIVLSGQKVWEDFSNHYKLRPEEITLHVWMKVGEGDYTDTGIAATIIGTEAVDSEDSDRWNYTFAGLPEYSYDNGEAVKIQYAVTEVSVTGYTQTSQTESEGLAPANEEGKVEDIVNTLDTVTAVGEKVWVDKSDYYSRRPDEDTFASELSLIGLEVGQTLKGPITIKEKDNDTNIWVYTVEDLPKYNSAGEAFTYSIQEGSYEEYDKSPETGTVEGTFNAESKVIEFATLTNTLYTTSLSGTKTWIDYGYKERMRPSEEDFEIKVYVKGTSDGGKDYLLSPQPDISWSDALTDRWTYTALELPKYVQGTDTEAIYYIEETAVNGYTAEYSADYQSIANTLDVLDITGSKTWHDNDDYYGHRPDNLELEVYRNDEVSPMELSDESEIQWDKNANPWTYRITNLPCVDNDGIVEYKIKEVVPKDYVQTLPINGGGTEGVTGADFENQLITITLEGSITFEDFDNEYDRRPTDIQLIVYADGSEMAIQPSKDQSEIVWVRDDANNVWTYEIINLPRYNPDGTAIFYQVKQEVPAQYYQKTPTEDGLASGVVDEETGNITEADFVDVLEGVDITGSKTWNDMDNKYNLRPENALLIVKDADTEEIIPYELQTQLLWSETEDLNLQEFIIKGLPKYRKDNSLAEYIVEEEPQDYYDENKSKREDNNFVNDMVLGALEINKTRYYGNDATFIFRVHLYVEDGDLDYGDYKEDYVLTRADGEEETLEAVAGIIRLKGDEKATITNLPAGISYEITEDESDYFLLESATNETGIIPANDTAVSKFVNRANIELGIINTTRQNSKESSQVVLTGGKVAIQKGKDESPDNPVEDAKDGEFLYAAWTPNRLWMLGSSFAVNYEEFPQEENLLLRTVSLLSDFEDKGNRIVVEDYINKDGSVKPITDSVYDELRARFPAAEIGMENGVVYLRFANSMENMPLSTHMEIDFVPTLMGRNVTPGGGGGSVVTLKSLSSTRDEGVMDGEECRFNCTQVIIEAEEGYMVNLENLVVREPVSDGRLADNKLFCVSPDGEECFQGELLYEDAGGMENLTITGHVERTFDESGNLTGITVKISNPEVPLDVEAEFVKKPVSKTMQSNAVSVAVSAKTGDRSKLITWLILLLTGIVTITLIIVKKRKKHF